MEMTTASVRKAIIQPARQAKWQRVTLLTVLGYEGAGALMGGAFLIARPDGALMDMPVDMMHGAFCNFLIPGIILLGLGILNTLSFFLVLRRSTIDWLMAGLALGGLVVWFIVEIIILQELHWLHLMWGMPVLLGWIVATPLIALRKPEVLTPKILLTCGILSSIWYVAVNIFVSSHYEGYNLSSFTVSELSALGAPTRILWVLLVLLYPLLFMAFGWGILQTKTQNKPLRIIGGLVIAYSIFNFYWPPMHMRGIEPTLTDTLHITWAMTTILLMIVMMAIGAAALGKQFRIYTIVSIVLLMGFGALTTLTASNIPINGPTPLIGIWERINITVFMLWVVVLAVALIRKENSKTQPEA